MSDQTLTEEVLAGMIRQAGYYVTNSQAQEIAAVLLPQIAVARPEKIDLRNVTKIERRGDQSVVLTFTSCYQAGVFERAARRAAAAVPEQG